MRNLMKVFCGTAGRPLAERMCDHLSMRVGEATVEPFADGEIRVKIDEDVRGADVFVVQPTSPPVNDNLMEMLILMDALRRASAERINAVIPYFGYARQDRKDEGRVPITAKLVANMITAAGADRVLALDLHAAQLQGFFDIPVDHLYAAPVFVDYFKRKQIKDLVLVAPDIGSVKIASAYSDMLGADLAIAITGIAGPDGGTPDKPVGTVWHGFYVRGQTSAKHRVYPGDRHGIRIRATVGALFEMYRLLGAGCPADR